MSRFTNLTLPTIDSCRQSCYFVISKVLNRYLNTASATMSAHRMLDNETNNTPVQFMAILRGLVAMGIGAFAGLLLFRFLVSQGFYAGLLPGAIVGMATGFASRIRSIALATVAAVVALAVGLVAEWSCFPFVTDDSFGYFIANITGVVRSHLVMLGLGSLCAFWFGLGHNRSYSGQSN